jgi:hypothetical protein
VIRYRLADRQMDADLADWCAFTGIDEDGQPNNQIGRDEGLI